MIFQIIVFLAIVLLALYLATQGWFSSTLVFVTSLFASILAGAVYEPMGSLLDGWRPDYGQGVVFLLTFFLTFSVLRIAADIIIPTNVKLPIWVDRVAGGFVGFFAGLVVVGTTVLGIEMMPVPTAIMGPQTGGLAGWDRYPQGVRMPESNLWLNPNGFVNWIYEMTLGRSMGSLGGQYTFAQAHPDLGEELWGYRNRTQLAAQFKMPPAPEKLARVTAAWSLEGPEQKFKDWPTDATRAIVVRTQFEPGTASPMVTVDPTDASGKNNFRATSSQIRLVVVTADGESQQFYPAGYIDHGPATKRELSYQTLGPRGHVVMDFPEKGGINVEWVFALPEKFDPSQQGASAFLEIKGLTRLELTKVEKAEPKSVNVAYAPLRWLESPFTVTVKVTRDGKPLSGVPVYFMSDLTNVKSGNLIQPASSTLADNLNQWSESTGGWSDALNNQPGGARRDKMRSANDTLRNLWMNQADVAWSHFLPHLLPSCYTVNSGENLTRINTYLEQKIKPALESSPTLRFREVTNAEGTVPPQKLPDGQYAVVAWFKEPDATYFWARTFRAEQKKSETIELKTEKPEFQHPSK